MSDHGNDSHIHSWRPPQDRPRDNRLAATREASCIAGAATLNAADFRPARRRVHRRGDRPRVIIRPRRAIADALLAPALATRWPHAIADVGAEAATQIRTTNNGGRATSPAPLRLAPWRPSEPLPSRTTTQPRPPAPTPKKEPKPPTPAPERAARDATRETQTTHLPNPRRRNPKGRRGAQKAVALAAPHTRGDSN